MNVFKFVSIQEVSRVFYPMLWLIIYVFVSVIMYIWNVMSYLFPAFPEVQFGWVSRVLSLLLFDILTLKGNTEKGFLIKNHGHQAHLLPQGQLIVLISSWGHPERKVSQRQLFSGSAELNFQFFSDTFYLHGQTGKENLIVGWTCEQGYGVLICRFSWLL